MSFQEYVNSIRGTKTEGTVQSGFSNSFADYVRNIKINKFKSSLHSEQEHDAVMRATYGSYGQYVAQQLENDTSLSDNAKASLIAYYGLSDSDTVRKNNAAEQSATVGSSQQSAFQKLVKGVNDGTVKVIPNISDSAVTQWSNSVTDVSKRVVEYLKKEGYKQPNTNISKEIDGYLSEAADIGQYIRANKLAYEDYEKAYNGYVETVNNLKDLKKAVDESNSFYSTFEGENDYNQKVENAKKLEKWADPDHLELLNSMSQAYTNIMETYNGWDIHKAGTLDKETTQKTGITTYYSKEDEESTTKERDAWFANVTQKSFGNAYTFEEFSNTYGGVSSEYAQAKRYQEGLKLTNDALNAEDFEKYSKIGKEKGGATRYGITWSGNAINMTDEENSIYNYYLGKYGAEKAEEYKKTLEQTLDYRTAATAFKALEDNTALELTSGINAGLDQFASGVANLFNTTDDYIPQTSTQMTSSMVREDLADDGFKILGNSIGQIGYDLINTTSNMLPSILTSTAVGFINPTAGAAVGAGLMGASASGNAYQEMLNLGYDKGQARSYSVMVGASEATLQYLLGGINKLGGKLTKGAINKLVSGIDNAYAKLAINYGGKIASEFTEEALQEVLSPFFQNIATGININTIEDIDWAQVFYSGLLGALSAGGLEGKSAISEAKNIHHERKTEKSFGSNINTVDKADVLAQEDSLDISAPLTNEQRSLLSTVPTETLNTVLGENVGNITLANLGISDTAMQQSFIEVGLADAEGNVNRQALTFEVKLRNDFTNIDGKTRTGYNNTSEDNFDIGGKTNDEVNTRRHREDRNRQDTSDRGRQGTRKDSWAEDKAGFIRRTKETGKSGRQRVIVETEKGKTVFAYTPAEPDNSPAYKAVSYLNDLGIKAVYCDGVMESNDGTVTYTHPEAATGPDGTIYVNKNSSISSEGIAVHEGTHHYERAKSEEYVALKTVIKSNLDMDSRAYIEFVKEIRDKYFTNIPIEQLNKDKLKQTVDRELVAYTNQFITTQPDVARIHFAPMFKNWSEVVRASRVFNKAIGLDFINHGAELQSFETKGKKETNSMFNEPNMSRATERIVNPEASLETQAHRNIIDIAQKLDLEIEIGDRGADLNGSSEGAKLYLNYGTQAPIRFVMTQALKEFARYSPNFAAFEKVIKETDNLQKWFSGNISNRQDNVLEFVAEALFDDDTGLRKILAVAVSKDRKAAKFVPDFMKETKKKLEDYPGIVEVLDELQYTFSEAAYDTRHERADNSDEVFYDNYSKDENFWKSNNKNRSSGSVISLKDKLTALFGKKADDGSAPSISEIVKLIEKTFGIPISSGKFRHKAYGIYRQKPETIRTKVANALPTIAHELGHHLDKKHNLSQLPSLEEAIEVLKQQRPDFISSYAPRKHPNEAVAEFVRIYLADRAQAKAMYPNFFNEFEATLSKHSVDELNNIRAIGDKINSYFTADKAERARVAILTRAEAHKINRRGIKLSDIFEKLNIQLLDDGAALKKVSNEAYNLYYFAKKSSVRAKNTISGYYMSGFDGDLVEMRDKNGNVIKDKDGKPQYVKALKYVLDGIDTAEQRKAFDDYLVYRHGIYWIQNDLRVFADDSLNNKEYMQSRIEQLEKQYPNFKKIAENLYDWYRTFIYEYGIKSGLLTKQQFKSMTDKYPCYVPFMRNVDRLGDGVKAAAANQSAPIRNAKGSGLDIYSPIENIVIKVEQFMKAADRNAIMQEIADVADTAEGKGYLLEQVPPSMVPVTVSVKTEPGDIIDDAITETITEFRVSDNQGMNVVRVYRNGEKTFYQVHDKNLLTVLTAMNTVKYNIVTRAAGNLTRVFKVLTTGGNAVWSLTSNAPRDFSSAYKYSSENNPFKFTVDYIKAIKSAFTEAYLGDKYADEAIKLYKSLGGGFNNSLSNSARELKLTIKDVFQKDKNLIQRVTANFNFIEMVERLADSIETAPRLAEFKRIYEKTGDAKAALSAAEEITVNFNRSGVSGKVIDQFVPYFNASLQGNRKFAKTLYESMQKGGDKSFVVKSVLSGVIKVGLMFAINNLIMGDDDNDEYEKLSAYKKNNFYNIYIGDGKFVSIPKSKDTAVFDSFIERTFEIAMKEDVEWSKEIEDFLSYLWLVFGPPLLDDTIGFSTALEIASNKDFTGAPIVPAYYEDMTPEKQYNEKTTYIAKSLGQLFGCSPMKIDHIIDSNFGVIGLLNRSVGKEEKDWTLGVKTKVIADINYSTDAMNNFYDKADEYSSKAKSYPDDIDALYKDEMYSSVRSIISELNQYGKEDEAAARDYRILANDYAVNYVEEIAADGNLLFLLKRTNNTDILPYKTFNADYSIDKVKYRIDSDAFVDYVEEYYSEISQKYRDILRMGYSDETTVAMLIDAKNDIDKYVSKKYKVAQ